MDTDTPNIISQTQPDFDVDNGLAGNTAEQDKIEAGNQVVGVTKNGCSDNNAVFVRSHYRKRTSISKQASKKRKMVPITKWFKMEREQEEPSQNSHNVENQIKEDRKMAKSMHIEMLSDLCRNINK